MISSFLAKPLQYQSRKPSKVAFAFCGFDMFSKDKGQPHANVGPNLYTGPSGQWGNPGGTMHHELRWLGFFRFLRYVVADCGTASLVERCHGRLAGCHAHHDCSD
jgi:hypothetical protein